MTMDLTKPVFVLNGPNLNMLGTRNPEVYGTDTLDSIEQHLQDVAREKGASIDFRQTNSETDLVNWIQEARDKASAIIINAAAYTHTSIAIHDALEAADKKVVEVHLSNIHAREGFRHQSYVSLVADAVLCGFGAKGYLMAFEWLMSEN